MPWPYQQQQMYGMGQAPRGYGGMMNAPVDPNWTPDPNMPTAQLGRKASPDRGRGWNPGMNALIQLPQAPKDPNWTPPPGMQSLNPNPNARREVMQPQGRPQQPRPNYPMYGGLGGIYGGYGGGYGGGSGGLGGYGGYPPAPQRSPYGTTWQDYRGGMNRPFNYPQRPPMYGGGDPRMGGGGYGGLGGMLGGYGGGGLGGMYGGMMPPQPSPYGGGLTRGFGGQMFGADPYAYAQQLGTLGAYQPQMPAQTDLQNLMGYQQQTFGQQVWPGGTTTPGPVATTPGPGTTTPGPGPRTTTPGPGGGTTTQGPVVQQYGQYGGYGGYGGYGRPPMYGGYSGYGSGGLGGMYGGAYGGYRQLY